MSSVKALIARHPALTYFALTFAISWGLVVLVVGPGGFPGTTEQTQSLLAYAVLGMVAGPSIAGIVLTAALGGRPARREFRQRLFKWDVGGRWYAAALLIAPAAVLSILLTLSLISRTFVAGIVINDHRTALMMFDVAWFVVIWVVIAAVGWSGLTRKHDREDFVEQRVSGSAIYVSELHWRVFASGGCVVAVAVAIWFARTTLLDLYAIGISHIAPEWQPVASYALDAIAGTVTLIGLLMLASAVGAIASTRATVTSQNVIVTTGVLRQHTFEMPLEQVEAVSVNQSLIGRWLDYGTVVIAGTGGTREAIDFLAAPHDFRRRIVEHEHTPDAAATMRMSA